MLKYHDLVQIYFERSNALTWFWTVYLLVIGGLLGFSLFRQRPDVIKTVLVTVLYALFAYKNLGAIEEVIKQRSAILQLMKESNATGADAADIKRAREALEPTFMPSEYEGLFGVRNFHILCDLLTIVAIWAMELRRKADHSLGEVNS
jgi:hypothetical protein